MSIKVLLGVLIIGVIGLGVVAFSFTQKSLPQNQSSELKTETENNWKSHSFSEVGLTFSAPSELSVRGEKIDESAFTLYVERGQYPASEYYQLYGMYNLNTGIVDLKDLKPELNEDSIIEAKVSGFPSLSGQYKGERNRYVTFILTDKGLFTLATSQPTTDNQKLTNEILNTFSIKPQGITDITANFEIYTNGTKRIFTDSKYHNQSLDVFITQTDPSLIYVKKTGTTWGEFFETLPMKLTKDCLTTGTGQVFCNGENGKLTFKINGVNSSDALNKIINNRDRLEVKFE